jgi:hypothetical protein
MFINGSHICSKLARENEMLCLEHECKKIITDTCNICLEEMKEFVFVKCGHSFHKECIGSWIINKINCPCCRQILKPELFQEFNIIHEQINQYNNRIITSEFIDWFFEMCRTYIEDLSNICLFDILYVIQTNINTLNYFINIFNNDINNISINLFELELKLNRISGYTRYINEINYESEYENDNESEYENDNYSEYIVINELEFTTFE